MNISNLIDIDAFTRGLTVSMSEVGLIIPLALVQVVNRTIQPMVSSIPYAPNAVDAAAFLWSNNIISNKT